MKGLFEDLKHALRIYRRTPGASLIAVAVLAVGLAFVTAFVSLYVDLVLKPHAGFEDSSQIVTYGGNEGASWLQGEFIDRFAEESTTLDAVAGVASRSFRIGATGSAAVGEVVTREFFAGLKPRLTLGRGFDPLEHESDGAPVVVISWRYWQQALGGRNDVLGTTLAIGASPLGASAAAQQEGSEEQRTNFRIIGVAAPEFTGVVTPQRDIDTVLWMPIEQYLPLLARVSTGPYNNPDLLRTQIWLLGIGRRAGGASVNAVALELNSRYAGNATPAKGPAIFYGALKGVVIDADVQRNTQRQLKMFLGASVLLALVAAANVSLFLLARAPGRRRELGIRMAVGAPVKRLARQLASEASVLVIFAAVIGLALSVWLARFLRGLEFLRRAQWRDVTLLDWRVLTIVGVSLATLTLLVALAPIVGLKKLGIAASSRQVSARATTSQRIAGTAQIAIAGTLGGAAIAFAWYLGTLMFGYPGYKTRDLHAVRYSIDSNSYYAARTNMFERYYVDQARRREAIESLPGVTGVSLASAVPGMRGGLQSAYFSNAGNPDPAAQISVPLIAIDHSYVELLGLTLLYGRTPTTSEPAAMLVNQALAREQWGRENVVGEVVGSGVRTSQVVGVLADLSFEHPSADPAPRAFATWTQQLLSSGVALVRSARTSADLRQQLQGLVDSGALELTINDVAPLAALRSNVLAADRARGFLTIGAAVLVVLVAAFGFYGTQRYLVSAGRREYAIRASLGAGPRALGRLVLRRGMLLGLPGLVLGLPSAFVLVAWLRDDYVSREIPPFAVTIIVALGLVALLLAASLGPARLARRTQPAPLLRED